MGTSLCPFCGLRNVADGLVSCRQCGIDPAALARRAQSGVGGVAIPQQGGSQWGLKLGRERTPDLTPVQRWFMNTRGSVPLQSLEALFDEPRPLGLFNVEGGTVSISTRPIRNCACSLDLWPFVSDPPCPACGHGAGNTVRCAAGQGDGMYPVWGCGPGSVLVSFLRSEQGLDTPWFTLDAMQKAAPLLLGSMDCPGAWHIADPGHLGVAASAPVGLSDVIVWIGVAPGQGADGRPAQRLSPVAVSMTQRSMADVLLQQPAERGLAEASLTVAQVAAAVWGDPSIPGFAHREPMDRLIAAVAAARIEEEGNQAGALVWRMHQWRHYPNQPEPPDDGYPQARQMLASSDPEHIMWRVSAFIAFGFQEDALADLRLAAAAGDAVARIMLPRWERAAAAGRDLFPVWGTVFPDTANHLGHEHADSNIELALDYWLYAALAGDADALASYTWHQLFRGEYADGIAVYETCLPACQARLEQLRELMKQAKKASDADTEDPDDEAFDDFFDADERFEEFRLAIASARSNTALLRLALTGNAQAAVAAWNENDDVEHFESMCYPALIMARDGDTNALVDRYCDWDIEDLECTFEEALDLAQPGTWAHEWFSVALAAARNGWKIPETVVSTPPSAPLNDPPQSLPRAPKFCSNCGVSLSGKRFCTNCGEPTGIQ